MADENDMPESDEMYGDGADAPAKPDTQPDDKDESRGEDMEATLPIGILQGKEFNPGDELVLVIKAIHDDGVQVAYAPAKAKDESEPAEKEPAAVPAGMGSGDSEGDY